MTAVVRPAIVFCNPSFWPHVGGIEHWVLQVARRLTPDFRVGVVTRRADASWRARESVDGMQVVRYRSQLAEVLPGRFRPLADGRAIAGAFRTLTNGSAPCVFNFIDPRPEQIYAARQIRRAGGAVICSLGGTVSERAPRELKEAAAEVSDALVAISGYAAKAFGVSHECIRVCYPMAGVPADFADRAATFGAGQVLAVCRVHPRKNLEALIDVAARCPELAFVVAGDYDLHRSYYDSLRARAETLGIANVRFVGNTIGEPLAKLYRESTVFFMPTDHEMFGLVFAEAMSYGLPVVAPAHTAVPEAVGAQAGILYPPGDQDACVAALRLLTTSHEAWLKYSAAAKAHVGRRLEVDFIGQYADILRRVATGQSPCASGGLASLVGLS